MVLSEARQLWPEYIGPDPAKVGECEFWVISEMNSQLIVHHPYRTLQELKGGDGGNGPSTTGGNGFTSSSTGLAPGLSLSEEETAVAWSIINDSYLTDLLLLHPPHVIAVTAIVLAVVLRPSQHSNLQAAGLSISGSGMPNMLNGANGANMKSFGANSGMSAASVASAAATAFAPPSDTSATASPQQIRAQKLVTWLAESEVSIEGVAECVQELVSLYEVWESYNEKDCKEKVGRFVKGQGLDK